MFYMKSLIYIKDLIKAIVPVLKYMILSYLVIFISFLFYNLMGYTDMNRFLITYGSYALVLFNIIYIIYLVKRNRILCRKTKPVIPFVMLGIGLSCFCNIIIIRINNTEVVEVNKLFLILSSVIVGPIVEEIIFRYILVGKLEKFNNRIVTILLASLIFALMHNGIINIIYTFILGIILNTIYMKNKNLLYPLIVHGSANIITLFLTEFNEYILFISFVLLIISLFIVKRDYLLK